MLDHALGGEHVLDLARADTERERAERAVGGGVRVAADDRHARLGDAELGADHVHDALAVGARASRRARRTAAQFRSSVSHLHARELVLDARRHGRAVGRRVVIGGRERAVGPAHRAPGQAQRRRRPAGSSPRARGAGRCRAARARPRGPPRSCRTASLASSSAFLCACASFFFDEDPCRGPAGFRCGGHLAPPQPGGDDRQEDGLGVAGVLEVVWQVGVEGHAVALPELVALRRRTRARPSRSRTSAVSRRPARASAGRRRRRCAPPAASVWRESSARWPGWAEVSTSKRCPRRALPPRWRWAGAHDRDRAVLVQAQQLREAQLQARGDPRRDRQRRAGLAALDLREHRRADAAAHARSRSDSPEASRSAFTRAPITAGSSGSATRAAADGVAIPAPCPTPSYVRAALVDYA